MLLQISIHHMPVNIGMRITNMTKDEMLALFHVIGFSAGYCVVERKDDGAIGTLDFNHGGPTEPRLYHNFQPA